MCLLFINNLLQTKQAIHDLQAGRPVRNGICVCRTLRELFMSENPPWPLRWDLIRYAYELSNKLIGTENKVQGACLVGVRMSVWIESKTFDRPLADADMVDCDEPVVIFRVPVMGRFSMDRRLYNAFVPRAAHELAGRRDMNAAMAAAESDTEKLTAMQSCIQNDYSTDYSAIYQQQSHPSCKFLARRSNNAAVPDVIIVKPPANFRCFGCYAVGEHFRQQCPRENEDDYVSFDRMAQPIGIPANQLIRVTDMKRIHDSGNMIKLDPARMSESSSLDEWLRNGTVQIFRHATAQPARKINNHGYHRTTIHTAAPTGRTFR